MRLALLAVLCSGCIAGSIKAHTGVVTDERGYSMQAGIALGFGIATGRRSGVVESVGFATGEAPRAGLALGLDYVRFLDRAAPFGSSDRTRLGWRAGATTIPLAYGPAQTWLHLATLYVLKNRASESGHEKMETYRTQTFRAVGIEGMIGATIYDQYTEMERMTLAGGAALTFEMYQFTRVSF